MRDFITISLSGLDLKQALEKYVNDYFTGTYHKLVFGWGIDFAYCGVCVPNVEFSIKLLYITDNFNGTATIEETEFSEKYLIPKEEKLLIAK